MTRQLEEALAIDGGTPIRSAALPSRHLFQEEEKAAVVSLLDRAIREGSHVMGYNGPEEEGYCKAFAESLGGGFADGVNSGTNALFVVLQALQLPAHAEVIVPAVTDPGGMMPVVMSNLTPIPADCAPGSYNIGAEQIARRISPRTAAIIVAHIAGTPADMDPILKLAAEKKIPVIEDCAQSHGALYKGRKTGSFGDISVFSTMFSKHHATGGQGGVVFTRNEDLYWRIRRAADRGKPFGLQNTRGNVVAALNCNMDEIHATIGRVQLRRLPDIIRRRRTLAGQIARQCLEDLQSVRLPPEPEQCESAYWFLILHLDVEKLAVEKTTFVAALNAEGFVSAPSHGILPARMDWFRKIPSSSPNAELSFSNIDATDASHFIVYFHEDWSTEDAADLVRAMAKIERRYRR